MLNNLVILLAVMGFTASAVAQQGAAESNTNTVELSESDKAVGEVVPTEKDLDNEITNAKLRAESGSKSKLSMSVSLGYSGGSLNAPFGKERPNYRRGLTPAPVYAGADVKARFRLNKNSSLSAGTGVTIIQPFHEAYKSTDNAKEYSSVSNPYLAYSSYYQASGLQMSTGGDVTYFSTEDSQKEGYAAALSLSQSFLGTVADDRLTIGVAVSAAYYFVDNSNAQFDTYNAYRVRTKQKPTTREKYREGISDYTVGIYPFAEYSLSDMFSLRTVFGYLNFEHEKGGNDLAQSPPYQSVGLGMALSRDLYVYPNIQFVPTDIRDKRTNVAVSATINAF